MKRAQALLVGVVGILFASQSADASLVSSITQLTGAGTAADVTFGSTADGGATVNFSIDVLQLHAPFNVRFNTTGAGSDVIRFNISLTNSATPATNIGNRIYQLYGQLFAQAAGSSFIFLDSPTATPWSQFNTVDFSEIFVGGERGHSFELIPGGPPQAITFYGFSSRATNTAGSFTLAFTANPEPETVILASLVCFAFGWLYYRRRQQGVVNVGLTPA